MSGATACFTPPPPPATQRQWSEAALTSEEAGGCRGERLRSEVLVGLQTAWSGEPQAEKTA